MNIKKIVALVFTCSVVSLYGMTEEMGSLRRRQPAAEAQAVYVDTSRSCIICLVEYANEDVVTRFMLSPSLSCGHQFHEACLYEWLGHNHSCPVCRMGSSLARKMTIEALCKALNVDSPWWQKLLF